MTDPTGNIVGSILQLQAQRLTKVDQRTQSMSAAIDDLAEQIKQLGKAQAITLAELKKD